MNENTEKYYDIIFPISNYCLNLCYQKLNLREYRNCYVTCMSFLDKKLELVEKNLQIVENIMQDKMHLVNNLEKKTIQTNPEKNNNQKNKYIFEDYYYQSNLDHDVGKPSKSEPTTSNYIANNRSEINSATLRDLSNNNSYTIGIPKPNSKSDAENEHFGVVTNKNSKLKIIVAVSLILLLIVVILLIALKSDKIREEPHSDLTFYSTESISMRASTKQDISLLTKFSMKCNDTFLNGFGLKTDGKDNYKYLYECKNISQGIEYHTDELQSFPQFYSEPTSISTGIFLDKLDVDCGNSSALADLSFNTTNVNSTHNLMFYTYKCIKSSSINYCGSIKTNTTSINKNDVSLIPFLSEQKISLSELQVMRGFKLISSSTEGGLSLFYNVSICHLVIKSTKQVDSKNGSIVPLSKLNVDCGADSALNTFGLILPNKTSMVYDFSCEKLPSNTEVIIKITNPGPVGKDEYHSTNFLDRHNVICDEGYAIQAFNLVYLDLNPKQLFYDYKCVKADYEKCTTQYTSQTDGADFPEIAAKSTFLASQAIKLQPKQVLKQFQLKTEFGYHNFPYYKYEYTYCTLK